MAIPATAMITVLAMASQKNAQNSEIPSEGVTSGDGVEPPGVGVYGVWNEASPAAIALPIDGVATGFICRRLERAYAANHGSRAAGPVGLSTSMCRFELASPGA